MPDRPGALRRNTGWQAHASRTVAHRVLPSLRTATHSGPQDSNVRVDGRVSLNL